MAFIPCSRCGQHYKGKQSTAYPAIVDGNERESRIQRLCPRDFYDLCEWLAEHADDVLKQETRVRMGCGVCSAEPAPLALFVTLYAPGCEREDWFARLCEDCAPAARVVVFGTETAP